jgi:hypothetical protein
LVSTPTRAIAGRIEEWFVNGAADGFTIRPPVLPGGPEDFVDHVAPELRLRGLLRADYGGRTLRQNHGLTRPDSLFEQKVPVAS